MKWRALALLALAMMHSTSWGADAPSAIVTKAQVAAAEQSSWTSTFASEFRYFSWRGNRGFPVTIAPDSGGGSGSEIYVPFALQLNGRLVPDVKLSIIGRGGWVSARQGTAGLSGEVATTTDTVVNATFTYLGLNGIRPFLSLNTNIPTGRSALFGSAAFARMDGDLVDIASFGEGWNIGPSVGFSLPLTGSLVVTASAGYTWRGNFDRERSTSQFDPTNQALTSVSPGDVWTGTFGVGYQDQRISANVTSSVSEESSTGENGVPLYRAGRRYVVAGTSSYLWPDNRGQTTLAASASHSNRNKVLFYGMPPLAWELMNSNSNLYRIGLQHLVAIGGLTIGPTGSWLYREHNGYDPTTFQFVPAKTRWAAGLLARKAITDKATLNARVEHVWVHEDEHPTLPDGTQFSPTQGLKVDPQTNPSVSSTGWQAAVGLNVGL
jgi:hypothetical protein